MIELVPVEACDGLAVLRSVDQLNGLPTALITAFVLVALQLVDS